MVFLLANASLSAVLVPFGIERLGGTEQVGLVVSALGVGFLVGALLIRVLVDRGGPAAECARARAGAGARRAWSRQCVWSWSWPAGRTESSCARAAISSANTVPSAARTSSNASSQHR